MSDSNNAIHSESLREAVANDDYEAPLKMLTQLETASVESLLDQLKTALEEERYDDGEMIASQLTEEFESRRENETETIAKVEIARDADDVSLSEVGTFTNYIGRVSETSLQRSKLLARLQLLLKSGQEEPSDVIDEIEATKSAEETIRSETESIKQKINDQALPPSIAVLQMAVSPETVRVNQSAQLTVKLENIGEETATDVSMAVAAPEQITVGSVPTVENVRSGEAATQNIELAPEEPGAYSVSVDVASENAGKSAGTTSFTVSADESNMVSDYANEEGIVDTDGLREAIDDWQNGIIELNLLFDVMNAWQTGETVT